MPQHRIGGQNTPSCSAELTSGSTSTNSGKYPLLVDPMIQESRVKKVLMDGGSSINVTFPKTLKAQGIPTTDLI
jgi:hypothetical protein